MARRGLARPRTAPVSVATNPSGRDLLPWVIKAIGRGRFTEEEYRQGQREREERHRAEVTRHVPPEVETEGADAVEAWVDEWAAVDGRLFLRLARSVPRGPRAPLDYSELYRLGRL